MGARQREGPGVSGYGGPDYTAQSKAQGQLSGGTAGGRPRSAPPCTGAAVCMYVKSVCGTHGAVLHPPPPPAVMNGSSHSPTAIGGAPSTPNGFSNGPATSCSAALSTQQLPPACGARQLSKLKRFLATLQQFGSDISPEIGERVRTLVLGLVVSQVGMRWPQAGPALASALPSPG